jgi:hypothetical protein
MAKSLRAFLPLTKAGNITNGDQADVANAFSILVFKQGNGVTVFSANAIKRTQEKSYGIDSFVMYANTTLRFATTTQPKSMTDKALNTVLNESLPRLEAFIKEHGGEADMTDVTIVS